MLKKTLSGLVSLTQNSLRKPTFNPLNFRRFASGAEIPGTQTTAAKGTQKIVHRGHEVSDTGDFVILDTSPAKMGLEGGRDPIDMIAQVAPIEVEGRVATCDGGHGALGHPRVFVNVDKGVKACGYCGLRYKQKPHHH